jgi:hypothetical protein
MDTFLTIGTMFHTGEKAPVSGIYRFAYHTDGTRCSHALAEKRIRRIKGASFPTHRRCNKAAIWRLESYPTQSNKGK